MPAKKTATKSALAEATKAVEHAPADRPGKRTASTVGALQIQIAAIDDLVSGGEPITESDQAWTPTYAKVQALFRDRATAVTEAERSTRFVNELHSLEKRPAVPTDPANKPTWAD